MNTSSGVELREITMENFHECIGLSVADNQRGFVASNVYSLAEAKADGISIPLAIYADGKMVGFTMYWFDAEHGKGFIDRLMVAEEFQGKGYGRAAMRQVIDRLCAFPGCIRIQTSYRPGNVAAESLYESLGFRKTGDTIAAGELVTILEVSELA